MCLTELILWSLTIYLSWGFIFAIYFAVVGVKHIDSHAVHGTLGFRLLIVPGAVMLWPVLMRRWLAGHREPPEEKNAHRCATRP